MYGLIVVEPEQGWPAVDREYYVVQSEFYTEGDFREPGLQPFSMSRAIDENPAYVVFNGRDAALVGDRALSAQVGEKVRLFIGNGGPNLVSSFHVIGEIFDYVYPEGGWPPTTQVQTTLIPAGGSAVVDFQLQVPGTFILVDHSIFRAFNKGAVGMLKVAGDEDRVVYSGREVDEVYLAERAPEAVQALASVAPDDASLPARISRGEAVFRGTCSTCHQLDGKGIAGVFPPLAGSDYLMADKPRSIRVVLAGLSGPVEVNGTKFDSVMPPLGNLTDHEIADVLSYVRNRFGNQGDAVNDAEVAAIRAALRAPAKQGHP
jgi:nitrite reductase (NO-forming)